MDYDACLMRVGLLLALVVAVLVVGMSVLQSCQDYKLDRGEQRVEQSWARLEGDKVRSDHRENMFMLWSASLVAFMETNEFVLLQYVILEIVALVGGFLLGREYGRLESRSRG